MNQAIFTNTYKLKKGITNEEFLMAFKDLIEGYISKQQGYLSSNIMNDGDDVWSDTITFKTMGDLKNFEKISQNPNELALKFYSFINLNSCKTNRFNIIKSFIAENLN